jgi:hypothetical protein
MSTDKDWEKWGSRDPYFGVLSSEKFRRGKLDQKAIDEFFAAKSRGLTNVSFAVIRRSPFQSAGNLVKGRPPLEPAMQLHVYNLSAVLRDLRARGFEHARIFEEPAMDGFRSVYVIARRG